MPLSSRRRRRPGARSGCVPGEQPGGRQSARPAGRRRQAGLPGGYGCRRPGPPSWPMRSRPRRPARNRSPTTSVSNCRAPPDGLVFRRVEDTAGALWKIWKSQHTDRRRTRLARSPRPPGRRGPGEDHMWARPRHARMARRSAAPPSHSAEPEPLEAAERSAGSAGENLGCPAEHAQRHGHDHVRASFRPAVGRAHRHRHQATARPRPHPRPGAHQRRTPSSRQAPVTPVRHIAEVITVVLDLVPHPAQRLAPGEVGDSASMIACSAWRAAAGRSRCQSGACHGKLRSPPPPTRAARVRPAVSRTRPGGLVLHAETGRYLGGDRRRPSARRTRPAQAPVCGRQETPICARRCSSVPDGHGVSTSHPGRPAKPPRSTVCSRPPIRSRPRARRTPRRPGSGRSRPSTGDPAPTTTTRPDRPHDPAGSMCPPVGETLSRQPDHPAPANSATLPPERWTLAG